MHTEIKVLRMVRIDLIFGGELYFKKSFMVKIHKFWNHTHPNQCKLFFQDQNYSSEDKIIPDTLV